MDPRYIQYIIDGLWNSVYLWWRYRQSSNVRSHFEPFRDHELFVKCSVFRWWASFDQSTTYSDEELLYFILQWVLIHLNFNFSFFFHQLSTSFIANKIINQKNHKRQNQIKKIYHLNIFYLFYYFTYGSWQDLVLVCVKTMFSWQVCRSWLSTFYVFIFQ